MPARKHTLEKLQEQSKRRYSQKDVEPNKPLEVLIIHEPVEELPMKQISHGSFLKKVKSIKPSDKIIDWEKIKKHAI
jgi:hypothetical protein